MFIAEMAYNALRTVAGEHTFQEFLENRGKLADSLEDVVGPQVHAWGLYIENIFIKGISCDKLRLDFERIDKAQPAISRNSEASVRSEHNQRKRRRIGSKNAKRNI
jgi:uncharacterized membrane protein YqiK